MDAPRRRSYRTRLVISVAAGVLVVDQLSKAWAVARLTDGAVGAIGSLRFNLAYNTGMAFSVGRGRGLGPFIAPLALLVVVVLVLSGGVARRAVGAVAAGLIVGGALGNLADRAFRGGDGFLHGAVVDFIDLQWWPIFNIADSAVVGGAILLVLTNLRAEPT